MSQFFLQPIFFSGPLYIFLSIFVVLVVKSYLNFPILFPISLQTTVFIVIIRDIFH